MSRSKENGESSRAWEWGLIAVGIAVYLVVAVYWPWPARHNNDFKHIYLGARALLERDDPYDAATLFMHARRVGLGGEALNPYVYLPATALTLSWLAVMPFQMAADAWYFTNHALAAASLWLIALTLWPRRRVGAMGALLVALALNFTLRRTLTAGQLNLVLLFCASAAFALLARGKERAAGAVMGFSAVFKLSPGAFGLFFLLRRRWRGLAAMVLVAAALLAQSVAAVGWKVHMKFLPVLEQMSYGHSTWQERGAIFWKDPSNQSPNSLWTHLLVAKNGVTVPWVRGTQSLANGVTWMTAGALLAGYLVVFGWVGWKRQAIPADPMKIAAAGDLTAFASKAPSLINGLNADFSLTDQAAFQGTLLLSLLVPFLMWDHYLVATILPVAWLVKVAGDGGHYLIRLGAIGCYLAICIPWPFAADGFRIDAGILLMSMKLFPTLALFALVCRARYLGD